MPNSGDILPTQFLLTSCNFGQNLTPVSLARFFHIIQSLRLPWMGRPSQPTNRRLGLIIVQGFRGTHVVNGGDIMENKPFLTETPCFRKSFQCFMSDCNNVSGHVIRLKHGTATIQVCLCNDCLKKSRESVLQGLGIQTREVLNRDTFPAQDHLRAS